jgi:hypothetical protein
MNCSEITQGGDRNKPVTRPQTSRHAAARASGRLLAEPVRLLVLAAIGLGRGAGRLQAVRYCGHMSRWLEHRSVWQFAVISWAFVAAAGLAGTVTSAWLGFGGHMRLPGSAEPVVFGSIVMALGAICGRRLRQKAAAAQRPPSTRSE